MSVEAIAIAVTVILSGFGATWYLSTLIGGLRSDVRDNATRHDGELEAMRADVNRHEAELKIHGEALNTLKFGSALGEIARAAKNVLGQ